MLIKQSPFWNLSSASSSLPSSAIFVSVLFIWTFTCVVHKLLQISPVVYNFSLFITPIMPPHLKALVFIKKAQITYRASPNLGNCTLFLISTVKSLAASKRGTFSLEKERVYVRTRNFKSNLTIYTIWTDFLYFNAKNHCFSTQEEGLV